MHYEITASLQSTGKHLTSAQRNSSLFSEAPRIGATTLRRGQVLKFNASQMAQHEVMLKRLFDAGAVEICKVDGKSRVDLRKAKIAFEADQRVLTDVKQEMKKLAKEEEEAPPSPAPIPEAPKAAIELPAAPEASPEPPPEPVKEATGADSILEAEDARILAEVEASIPEPSPSAPSSESKKSKKGRK